MSSIASIILVIVMAFSSVLGANVNLEGTTSFEAKVDLDMQMVMAMSGANAAEEGSAQIAKGVADILGAVTLKGVADKESAELDLFTGEDLMLSLGVKKEAEGATFASTLLPNTALYCSNELIEKTQEAMMQNMAQNTTTPGGVDFQSMMEQMQNMDWEQIGKDFAETAAKVSQVIEEKKGPAETGEFVVDEMTFTSKVPVNITYAELTELLLTSAKELFSKESVKPLLETLAKGTDITAEIDKALENLKNQPKEQQYELTIASYTDEKEGSYTAIDCTRQASEDGTVQAEDVHFGLGQVEGKAKVLVTALNGTRFDLTAGSAEDGGFTLLANLTGEGFTAAANAAIGADGSSDVTVDVNVQGMPVRSHTVTTVDGERVNFSVEVFMMSMEKPMLAVTGSAGKGGELSAVYEGEDITVIPVEKLMDDSDTETATKLQTALMAGITKGFTVLVSNVPEDTGKWLSQMMVQMMNPGAQTEEQTNP